MKVLAIGKRDSYCQGNTQVFLEARLEEIGAILGLDGIPRQELHAGDEIATGKIHHAAKRALAIKADLKGHAAALRACAELIDSTESFVKTEEGA